MRSRRKPKDPGIVENMANLRQLRLVYHLRHGGFMNSNQSLLGSVLERLSKLPGTREFKTSVLISQPRKTPESLFPYAPNVHEADLYIQDVVILVAERVSIPLDDTSVSTGGAEGTEPPLLPATTGFAYVSALEAVVYIFPITHSAIVYISKVDSTGQGKRPSPTRALMLTFLEFVTTRWFGSYSARNGDALAENERGWDIWIQLFARAQNQYLFPASIEYPGKRVLSDIGLVKWWRSVLDEYASEVIGALPALRKQASKYIIIPGLSAAETSYTLKLSTQNGIQSEWIVGNPYSNSEITFPLGVQPPCSISQLIPFFPDDPKARLLVEIANTTTKGSATLLSPPRKKRKLDDGQALSADEAEQAGDGEEEEKAAVDYLRTVPAEEFWERIDGRQECCLGTVAFFTVLVDGTLSPHQSDASSSSNPPITRSYRAEVPLAVVRKISAALDNADFGTVEKSCRSTERLQDSIEGLSSGVTVVTSRIPGIEDGEDVDIVNEQELLSHITQTIEVSNPELEAKPNPAPVVAAPVTVLAVRKKKPVAS